MSIPEPIIEEMQEQAVKASGTIREPKSLFEGKIGNGKIAGVFCICNYTCFYILLMNGKVKVKVTY